MKIEKIYSPIFDKNIYKDIANSPIWNKIFKEDELVGKLGITEYTIKFDGLSPIQVTKIRKLSTM